MLTRPKPKRRTRRFAVVLELPDDAVTLATLRRALKHLRRAWSVRCTEAREVRDDGR